MLTSLIRRSTNKPKGRGGNPSTIVKKISKIFILWYYYISATYKPFKSFLIKILQYLQHLLNYCV